MLNLVDALDRVVAAIQTLEQTSLEDQAPAPGKLDREMVAKQIHELDAALADGQAPDKLVTDILGQLRGQFPPDTIESLTFSLDSFEFETARSILAEITDKIAEGTE